MKKGLAIRNDSVITNFCLIARFDCNFESYCLLYCRDLDKEVRSGGEKMAAPTEKKLKNILHLCNGRILEKEAFLKSLNDEEERDCFSKQSTTSVESNSDSLNEDLKHFSATFEETFGRFIKIKEENVNPPGLGEPLNEALSAAEKLHSRMKAQRKLRECVEELEKVTL